ncbi:hypothetical protein CO179_04775 [candidate division WWE3 bacterium CG_4_9_14_3_um_filter_39_7]|uniref:Queuosine 5'-phosphate N-glycosylase/hydrolase n=1 Tax=candidate division WWE3 bacterium CG_4_9_14_3_um_filter_39_7 TaxID=1975080 RepID=A0A2M7X0I9_UNCKA|nr:MAG: hypothetical protein CO179_04775 [candidate division WWE3 bacterium CG_4_9_14_3_um_filter_39_7]
MGSLYSLLQTVDIMIHMDLQIVSKDPLKILYSTKSVVKQARSVWIDYQKIESFGNEIESKIRGGLGTSIDHFGTSLPLNQMVQLVFIEDVLNFCTWSPQGGVRWRVSYPIGTDPSTGWYGKAKAFKRALDNNIPILEAMYLMDMTKGNLEKIFKGVDDIMLPLMSKRVQLLREAGTFLKKYDGQFLHVIEDSGFDAINLSKILIDKLPGFQDKTKYDDRDVYFYKRAQICASDVSVVMQEKTGKPLSSLSDLTAFADNALPHFMRRKGVLQYSKELIDTIDSYTLLESGSKEEVEIRAATIWVAELVRQQLKAYSIQEIDYAIWQLAQAMPVDTTITHHRTYSIFY